jgi:hypothetical protein
MLSTMSKLLAGVRLGEPVSDAGLTIIPVFGGFADAPKFITLAEALAADTLTVTEVDAAGSVPNLCARNDGTLGVLILDGEELVGAKQNRVLNTSVFLKPGTEISIPVSCVERGRWSYLSARFSDSGNVSAHRIRQVAHASVTRNLRGFGGYESNQGEVWAEVDALTDRHCVESKTAAMRDVFEQRRERIREREARFAVQPGQAGLFALWGGKVVGFDVVATTQAYARLHDRLLGSYALDALDDNVDVGENDFRTAKEFVVALADVKSTRHHSPGDGSSHRYTGDGLAGSVLTVDRAIVHAVFFGIEDEAAASPSRYPSARDRRERFGW